MKYFSFIWANLKRRKVRLLFTVLSIFVAFILYGALAAVKTAFTGGIDFAAANRLITIHKISIIQLLPISYRNRIAAVDGVRGLSHGTWFGGFYQDQRNQLGIIAVGDDYLDIAPEISVTDEVREKWRKERIGALVGPNLIKRFNWQVGDRIPITTGIWPNKNGTDTWEFVISGVYTPAAANVDPSSILFHYEYLDEARAYGEGLVGWYFIVVDNQERSAEIATEIDGLFANSATETKTSPEQEWAKGFVQQVGDIGAIFTAIVSVVFFTLLLITANTMAQSVRERTSEIAVMKAIGFTKTKVVLLILSEALLLALIGGGGGLLVIWGYINSVGDVTGFLPSFLMRDQDVVIGFTLVLLLGFLTGAIPAWRSANLNIVNAFRKIV
ncbi:MAG: FtsX-like permease family protein [Gammaproteobacteria bacterium]|nr:FtsX-like permease family protein [Gammaproteobacteria bacterium]